MDPQRSPNIVVPRRWPIERRVHKRFVSDEITLTFLGTCNRAINWSQGGILVADIYPDLPIGSKVWGLLNIKGHVGFFRFSAKLVRRDAQVGQVAFQFDKLFPVLLDALFRLAERSANEPPSDLDGRQ
jgi:hypothetical protein